MELEPTFLLHSERQISEDTLQAAKTDLRKWMVENVQNAILRAGGTQNIKGKIVHVTTAIIKKWTEIAGYLGVSISILMVLPIFDTISTDDRDWIALNAQLHAKTVYSANAYGHHV